MKYLALCVLLSVVALGCDASGPEQGAAGAAGASVDAATFPFGLSLASTGAGGLVPSRRKVCYTELSGQGETQCVVNRTTASDALSFDGSFAVQQFGFFSGQPFDVLSSLNGFSNVVRFEVGQSYEISVCGAGNTFHIEFLRRVVPDFGAGDVPGLAFQYVDDGQPGRPAQYGVGGQLELVSAAPGVAEATPILLFVPISSGPACEF